jgi:hypothetical protein
MMEARHFASGRLGGGYKDDTHPVAQCRLPLSPQAYTMPSMPTVSQVVVLPNEYNDMMASRILQNKVADFDKPLIYVTHPDNLEDELWVPPVQEESAHLDEDSDDGTCTCSDTTDEMEYESKMAPEYSPDAMGRPISSLSEQQVTRPSEMWFYRTGWQNRGVYSTDTTSSKMIYYADIPWRAWGTSLTIYRDNKSGEVAAESYRSGPGKPFEITFPNHLQREYINGNKLVLKFGCIYSTSHTFTYRGRDLAWKHGFLTSRLRDVDTHEVIAEFHSKALGIHRDGKMVIMEGYAKDPQWVDVIVTTALTCQQREREIRRRAGSGSGGGP